MKLNNYVTELSDCVNKENQCTETTYFMSKQPNLEFILQKFKLQAL